MIGVGQKACELDKWPTALNDLRLPHFVLLPCAPCQFHLGGEVVRCSKKNRRSNKQSVIRGTILEELTCVVKISIFMLYTFLKSSEYLPYYNHKIPLINSAFYFDSFVRFCPNRVRINNLERNEKAGQFFEEFGSRNVHFVSVLHVTTGEASTNKIKGSSDKNAQYFFLPPHRMIILMDAVRR